MRADGGRDDEAEREQRDRDRRRDRERRLARERRRRRREERRQRREGRRDAAEAVGETCELVDSIRGLAAGCGRLAGGRGGGGGGGGCDCNGPCDFALLRVSTMLLVAAAVVPARGASGLVRASLRGYQRWLTRFTPACPSTPSCSAYALAAVGRHGARRGLRLAAARVRACGAAPATSRGTSGTSDR